MPYITSINDVFTIKTEAKHEDAIDALKGTFGRIMLALVGFTHATHQEPYDITIRLNNCEDLAFHHENGEIYLGIYNKHTGNISTSVDSDKALEISKYHIDRLFTKLSRAETTYTKNGHLPAIMDNPQLQSLWQPIILDVKNRGLEPNVMNKSGSELLLKTAVNYYTEAKSTADNIINSAVNRYDNIVKTIDEPEL